MATFYSKNIILMAALSVMSSAVYAQTSNAPAAAPNKSVVLKMDANRQAYYIDADGDKVIVLDYKTRRTLEAVTSYKKEDPNKTKMYPKTFYKETVPDKFDEPKAQFKTYTVEEGDTWEGISKKIYDTDIHWVQLKLWNEDLQKDPKLPEGAEIKYLPITKK